MARLLIIIFCISVSSLYSQSIAPINPDRPDQSNSPDVLPLRTLQFETGYQYQSQKFDSGLKIKTKTIPDFFIRYGLFENTELRFEAQNIWQTNEFGGHEWTVKGFGPLALGTKIKICNEKGFRPEMGFQLSLVLPNTGVNAFQIDYTAPEIRLLMQSTISKWLSVSYNIGEVWDGFSPGPSALYAVSFGITATKKIGGFIESYGFLKSGEAPDHRADAGITYLIRNNIQADIYAGLGITDISPDFIIGAGFSFRLPK